MTYLVLLALSIGLSLVILAGRNAFARNSTLRLPPGPIQWPIVGNLSDLPPKGLPGYQHWQKHRVYGPITSVTVMGQTVVAVHDKIAAHDILDKRSRGTSSRPSMEFGHKLCGYENLLPIQPFGNTYRRRRKLVHRQFGTKAAVIPYQTIQDEESRRNALRILNRPEELVEHMKTFAAAVILKILYGYTVEPAGVDPLVSLIERMLDNVSAAFVPMTWIVDMFPPLQHLPVCLGASFKNTAKSWRMTCEAAVQVPYSFTVQQMEAGIHQPSYVSNVLEYETNTLKAQTEDDIKWTALALFAAGTETTSATLTSFILAMIMFPSVQCKAQEEIDRVIGTDRLPTFDDKAKLPYISRVVTEAYRWFPILPLGIPHYADEDILYEGYNIPKGASILPAIWGICHDPALYSNPADFDPDRYLSPRNEPDPREVAFGFGRRICPGRFLAESSIFISITHILAVFTIGKAVDEHGMEIEVKVEPQVKDLASDTNHVNSFAYSIVPRTETYAKLIRDTGKQPMSGDGKALIGIFEKE